MPFTGAGLRIALITCGGRGLSGLAAAILAPPLRIAA